MSIKMLFAAVFVLILAFDRGFAGQIATAESVGPAPPPLWESVRLAHDSCRASADR